MMAISVGLPRYSLSAIRYSKEFVISFPSETMIKEVEYFGTKSGRDTDKLADCGTKTQPAEEIDCVLLSDAVSNFECVLENEMVTGDHVIFVGRIVAAHTNKDKTLKRVYSMGGDKIKPLSGEI